MKKIVLSIIAIAFIVFTSCKEEKKEPQEELKKTEKVKKVKKEVVPAISATDKKDIMVRLESKSDSKVAGKLHLKEVDGIVKLEAKFMGLTPGLHAIHIHEKADCSSADGKSSGGHWNPTFKNHGKWGDKNGYHKGDIGNFTADEKGNGVLTMETDEWCISCKDETKNIVGKAIIVHQGTDDFVSQPSGAAGARVSCGGIIQ